MLRPFAVPTLTFQTLFRVWDIFFVEGHDVSILVLSMTVVTNDQGALPYRDIYTQNERGLDYGLRKRLGPLHIHVEHDVEALDSRQTYCRECNVHYLSL